MYYDGTVSGGNFVNRVSSDYTGINTSTMRNGTGINGDGLNFTDTDGYITITDDDLLIDELAGGSWSFSAWVKPDVVENTHYTFSVGQAAAVKAGLEFKDDANNLGFRYYDFTGWEWDDNNDYNVENGEWLHVAVTYNITNNQGRIYYDGVTKQTATFTAYSATQDRYLIGARSDLTNLFDGMMDEISIWNRTLSIAEVAEINDSLYYPFTDLQEIRIQDSYNDSYLNIFNATASNLSVNISNTTTTGYLSFFNLTGYYNLTITAPHYFNKTFNNTLFGYASPITFNLSRGTVRVETDFTGFNVTLLDTSNGNVIYTNETTTNRSITYYSGNFTTNITVNVSKVGYTYEEITFINNQNDQYIYANIIKDPSILNITIYNEVTNTPIQSPVSLAVVGASYSNYSNTTGVIYADNLTTGDYEIIYSSPDFYQRRYYLTVSLDSFTNLRLYLLNKSNTDADLITYEVTDQNGVPLTNMTVKALRFYPEENAYKIVEMSTTDVSGTGGAHLEKINPKYRFFVENTNGNLVLTTIEAQLFSNNVILRVDESENVIQSLSTVTNITKSLTFNNATNTYTLTWNDPRNIVNEVCLEIKKITFNNRVVVNSSCTTGPSGVISLGIGANVTGQYIARGLLETNTQFSPYSFIDRTDLLNNPAIILGGLGFILAFFIVVGLSLTGVFLVKSPVIAIVMGTVGLIFSAMFGLIAVGIAIVMGIIIVALMVIFLTRSQT